MGKALSKSIDKAKSQKDKHDRLVIEGGAVEPGKINDYVKKIVKEMPKLEKLMAASCGITELPDVSCLSNLRILDLENNQLKAVHPSITSFSNLQELYLSKNKLSIFPEELAGMVNLNRLDLNENELKAQHLSPLEMRRQTTYSFSKLQSLMMGSNQLDALPHIAWSTLKLLERLLLEKNKFTVFPSEICSVQSLTSLNMTENQLTELPEEISSLNRLIELFLRGNKLTALPDGVGRLTSLRTLDVSHNQLSGFPSTIGQMQLLKSFYAQHNQIEQLGDQIRWLCSLNTLHLHNNKLQSLPAAFVQLTALADCQLNHNSLNFLPVEFHRLRELHKLHLQYNKLQELPEGLEQMVKLNTLLLDHNELKSVPQALLDMKVVRISLDGNPFGVGMENTIKEHGSAYLIKKARSQLSPNELGGTVSASSSSSSINHPPTSNSSSGSAPNSATSSSGSSTSWRGHHRRRSSTSSVTVPEGVIPPYEEFQLAFENLLVKLNLSKDSAAISAMSTEQKWTLLQKYRAADRIAVASATAHAQAVGSGRDSVKGSGGSMTHASPGALLQVLIDKPTRKEVVELRVALSSKPLPWVDQFCEEGGIDVLIRLLSKLPANPTNDDLDIQYEALKAFHCLLGIKSKFRLLITIQHVFLQLATALQTPSFQNRALLFTALEWFARNPNGHKRVLEGLSSQKRSAKTNTRWTPLLQSMLEEVTELNSREIAQMKVNCLSLLNVLLKETDDLKQRFDRRIKFLARGILSEVNQKTELAARKHQNDEFIHDTIEDFESVLMSKSLGLAFITKALETIRDGVKKFSASSTTENVSKSKQRSPQYFAMISSPQLCRLLLTWADATMPPQTIVKALQSELSSSEESAYGFYWPTSQTEGKWLRMDAPLFANQLPSEVIWAEFKLLPWNARVEYRAADKTLKSVSVQLDPNQTVGALIWQLVPLLVPAATSKLEEYDLYSPDKKITLQDTAKLLSYPLRDLKSVPAATKNRTPTLQKEEPQLVLHLCRKPLQLKMQYNEITEVMPVDPAVKLSQLQQSFGQKVGLSSDTLNEFVFALFRAATPKQKEWPAMNLDIDNCKITERDVLSLVLRPRVVPMELPTGKIVQITLDLNDEVMGQISRQLNNEEFVIFLRKAPSASPRAGAVSSNPTSTSPRLSLIPLKPEALRNVETLSSGVLVLKESALAGIDPGTHIWSEPPDDPKNFLVAESGAREIRALSVNQIIQRVTDDQRRDTEMVEMVLSMWTYAMSAGLLFAKLCERFEVPSSVGSSSALAIRKNVIELLRNLVEHHWHEIQSIAEPMIRWYDVIIPQHPSLEKEIAELSTIVKIKRKPAVPPRPKSATMAPTVHKSPISSPATSPLSTRPTPATSASPAAPQSPPSGGAIRNAPRSALPPRPKEQESNSPSRSSNSGVSPSPSSSASSSSSSSSASNPSSGSSPSVTTIIGTITGTVKLHKEVATKENFWLDSDELDIARQLTLEAHKIFAAIKESELMHQAWNKTKLQHQAPNLLASIERFNHLSAAVATAICTESKVRVRARLLAKFVSIGHHLRTMNNFLFLEAVILGIDGASCLRLKWTRSRLAPETAKLMEEIIELMTMQASFKRYRELLQSLKPPLVPYIGVALSDLTFAEDGNPDTVQNLVNWGKIALIHRIIRSTIKFQSVGYDFSTNHELQQTLRSLPVLPEEKLYELSLMHEPRNAPKQDIK